MIKLHGFTAVKPCAALVANAFRFFRFSGEAMRRAIERRQFLEFAGKGALVVAGAGFGLPAAVAARPSIAEAAVGQAQRPRLLLGCNAYSYRELLEPGKMTLEDFILKAADLRLDGVDMTVYYLKSTEPEYLDSLRQLAFKNAIPFSGAACNATMVQPTADKRADALAQIKKWLDVTDRLGAPHLKIFAGPLPSGVPLQQATDWTVETMKVACDYAAQKGIMLGIEDHVGVSQSADVCLEIMHRVNSPYAGITLDICHFKPTATQDEYAQIKACLPYATVTHIRDHFDDHTPIDMDRVWKLYALAGYRGYMSIEYNPAPWDGGEPAVNGVPKLAERIRALNRKYSSI
jgi:sugar phosphate isomerase/epimerase